MNKPKYRKTRTENIFVRIKRMSISMALVVPPDHLLGGSDNLGCSTWSECGTKSL